MKIGRFAFSIAGACALVCSLGCTKDPYSGEFARIVKLAVAAGVNTPPAANISPTSTNLSVLQLALTAGPDEQVKVGSIVFTESGSANAQVEISAIGLYVDTDRDGNYSPAVDTIVLGSVAGGYAADDTVTFSGLNRIIHPGGTEYWILVYSLSGTAVPGDMFIPSLEKAEHMTAAGGGSGRPCRLSGPPVTGNTMTVQSIGSMTVSAGASNPPAAMLPPLPVNQPMLQIRLEAGLTENVVISSITFTSGGSGNADTDISSVVLYNDLDASGTVTAGDVTIGAATTFSGGKATFAGLAETITAGAAGAEHWLVVCTITAGAPSDTFNVRLASNTDIIAAGAISLVAITPTGAPVPGNNMMIPGGAGPTLTVTDLTPPAGINISHIESDLVMLHLRFTASGSEGTILNSLTFHASAVGTGHDRYDISSVCLFQDVNTDGVLQKATDPLITPSSYGLIYSADGGSVTFGSLSRTIAVGNPEEFLLVYYMGGNVMGTTHIARFDPSTDISAVGAISGNPVTFSGAAITGPTASVTVLPGWTQTFASTPVGYVGEYGHSAIYDESNRRIVIFGGELAFATDNNDTWEIDLTVAPPTWTQITFSASPPPAARHGHSAVYLPPGVGGPGSPAKMLVFGGWNSFTAGPLNDIWELDLTAGLESWSQITPAAGPVPTARCYHAAVWDTANSRIVVYGGSADRPPILPPSPPASPRTMFNDVWALNFTPPNTWSWSLIATSGTPPPSPNGRAGHTALHDDKNGRMIVFSGCDYTWGGNEMHFNDVHYLDVSAWAWTQPTISGTPPTGRYVHTAVIDEIGRRMFVFAGGQYWTGPGFGTLSNDYFVYNISTSQWNQLPTSLITPTVRYNHAGAYDYLGNRSIQVTGRGAMDAWEYK